MGIQSRTILSYSVLHRICCSCTPDTDTSAGVSATTHYIALKTADCGVYFTIIILKSCNPMLQCSALPIMTQHDSDFKSCVNQSPAEGACCQAGRCDSTDHVQSPHSVTMIHRPSAPCAVSGVLCAAPHLRIKYFRQYL